jgi:hypothetical protein
MRSSTFSDPDRELTGPILIKDTVERIRRLEDECSTCRQENLPFFSRLEAVTTSINESLIGIKGDLKEVKSEVRTLATSHQLMTLNLQDFNTRVISLETIEKDRKDRKKLVVKTILTAAGTVAAAVVVWYFGLK